MKMKAKRKKFSIIKSSKEIEQYIQDLTACDEVYKIISMGKFASISFVKYIIDRTNINEFYCSSFRIRKKEIQFLDAMFKQKRLRHCFFVIGSLMENDSEKLKRYKYYENFKGVCDNNKWEYRTVNNHSKLLLFDTDKGKFVLETSSNLNENPKIEQFSLERSEELFEYYKEFLLGLGGDDDG